MVKGLKSFHEKFYMGQPNTTKAKPPARVDAEERGHPGERMVAIDDAARLTEVPLFLFFSTNQQGARCPPELEFNRKLPRQPSLQAVTCIFGASAGFQW